MKITVLTENTGLPGFRTEHGLSLYLETSGHRILFDTGQTSLFAENADLLHVDLAAVDLCVLSHGHYDHGGGLSTFLERNQRAKIYMSRYAFGAYYNGTEKYIGLTAALKGNERIVLTDGVTALAPHLTLYSCNDRPTHLDLGSFGLTKHIDGKFVPDDFLHEHYLLIEENGRRFLISGCSHKGIINIEEWFRPDVLIGGFHFVKLPPDDTLAGLARLLDAYSTDYYTCHCTGTEQYAYMKKYMKHLHYLSTGQTIEL